MKALPEKEVDHPKSYVEEDYSSSESESSASDSAGSGSESSSSDADEERNNTVSNHIDIEKS